MTSCNDSFVAVGSETLDQVRAVLASGGTTALVVDRLTEADLLDLEWSGARTHIVSVAAALARVDRGAVDYFAVRAPDGKPIAKGGVDHEDPHGPGKLWQLATHPELQSRGLGTHLIAAMETSIRRRGLPRSWLGVETDNPRALRLYERLGYGEFARERDGWETQDNEGNVVWYETDVILMDKTL